MAIHRLTAKNNDEDESGPSMTGAAGTATTPGGAARRVASSVLSVVPLSPCFTVGTPLACSAVPGKVSPLATLITSQVRVEGPAPHTLVSGPGQRHFDTTAVQCFSVHTLDGFQGILPVAVHNKGNGRLCAGHPHVNDVSKTPKLLTDISGGCGR